MNSIIKRGLSHFQKRPIKNTKNYFTAKRQAAASYAYCLFDSRVSPELITNSLPEKSLQSEISQILFPLQRVPLTSLLVIEYAIKVLKVEQIIICGHSNCGGQCCSELKL